MRETATRRRGPFLTVALGAPLLLAGCDFIFGSDPEVPSEAVVEVEGEAAAPLLVVLSKDFQIAFDPSEGGSVSFLLLADTVVLEPGDLPFTTRLDVQPENRLLARVVNPSADTALVRLIVRLDGDIGHDRSVRIADNQYIEFSTTY